MRPVSRRASTVLALSSALVLVAAVSANAIPVAGHQKVVNEKAGKYKMKGDLIGKWKLTTFRIVDTKPVLRIKGTEKFNGCLDTSGDRSCEGEPTGVMYFKFRYWAQFDDDGQILLGACAHPVTGGKGAFAGATGFLAMFDTPLNKPPFFKTRYEGEINLAGSARPGPSAPPHC